MESLTAINCSILAFDIADGLPSRILSADQPQKKCLLTGVTGYLGSRLKTALEGEGWQVSSLSRRSQAGPACVEFSLGQEIAPTALMGADALVHCAYDFKPLSWAEIYAINVAGTQKLLRAAREAKVPNLVYVSSISSFEGCRAMYGQAKLEAEKMAQALGAIIIRPGLIWGKPPGAMFERLQRQAASAKVLPLFGGGQQVQYLIWDQDLCRFIARCAGGDVPPSANPITIANETPWTLRQILEEMARVKGKRIVFVPVPWRLVWIVLKLAEACRAPLSFRSDNLVSFIYQNPSPSFEQQRRLGLSPRPFQV